MTITLNPQRIAGVVLRALSDTLTTIRIGVPAIQEADFAEPRDVDAPRVNSPPPADGRRVPMSFRLSGDKRKPEDKKAACLNWLLSRGFQELARAVRNALEEVHVYIAIVQYAGTHESMTWGEFQDAIAPARKQARKLNFPGLMEAVNKGLSKPLHFEKEFLSFQKVRNCLEHRDGRVTQTDTDDGKTLVLSLPRMMLFYERGGQEIEIRIGERIEGEDGEGVHVFMRMITDTREFRVGERISFSADEFDEIGYGCWAFANDLSNKLPTPEDEG